MKKLLTLFVVAFVVLGAKHAWAESKPDLSTSTVEANIAESDVIPGQLVTYTVTLKNRGTMKATDFDFYMELDPGFSDPENFTFHRCGKKVRNQSGEHVDISNLTIKKEKIKEKTNKRGKKKVKVIHRDCVITFDVRVNPHYSGGEVMNSEYYLSGAAEGGDEMGPIPTLELEVR